MAVEPIIDLSPLDLSRREMSRADIARFNPHRGVMAQLDGVVWLASDLTAGVAVKEVRADEFWCAGHIPGYPIMPGVLMIEAGAQLASLLYYRRSATRCFAGFVRIEEVVFRGQVVPGDTLFLLCKEIKYSPKRFITSIQGMVRGEVIFEGVITGMMFPNMGEIRPPGDEAAARPAPTA
ncbi:MAG TPA: beta-hydroxyacyl-ACP dehydratase [Phycisphaerales bacterium]|nr:beta-hydroxyacyl-ACP dehydratase [Phycisphaerales bacterium]